VGSLLEELAPRIYRFALRLTCDSHAAEDLTQETLLRAWRRRDRLREPHAARVWLFAIAVNLWRDALRRGRHLAGRAGPLVGDPVGRVLAPDADAARQEDLRRALDAMDALPERQREVLYLSACEGLALAEVASVLGITASAAKASLSLARRKLREELSDLVDDL
jgi:RNA polymerase sigma-70 factor (ECF subfamily)